MQRMSVIASFQKYHCRVSVRVRTRLVGRIGSGVRVSACFQKNARLVGRLRPVPRLTSRIGSGVDGGVDTASWVGLVTVFTR